MKNNEFEFLYSVRTWKKKVVKAKDIQSACNKFMKSNKIEVDNLTIDYEVWDKETGDMIDISNIESVKNLV